MARRPGKVPGKVKKAASQYRVKQRGQAAVRRARSTNRTKRGAY